MSHMIINGRPVYVKREGAGKPLFLLHAAGSSGIQWSKIREILKERYQLYIPDLYGEGKTPPLEDWSYLLDEETQLIRHLIDSIGESVHLVGHSYGGVLAMRLALSDQHRIASLTLIEPVVFNLLRGVELTDDHKILYDIKNSCTI
ncbi:MAG TPA: alpha/beta fold hydrolase, partial [Syntrophales bacterium]|nr:alpha/beta fold hydrolase [Syntrophales bacterium]